MDQYQLIRQLYLVEGLSQRAIARSLGISRHTVKRYCDGSNLPWERKKRQYTHSVVTNEVIEFIKQCFQEDQQGMNRRQRHTAHRIYQRLCQEKGFHGGESTIRRVVKELKMASLKKAFVPLVFAPGEAIQVDWGTATVILHGEKTEVYLFCMRLCHSCAPFVMAFPSQREEAFLEGHATGFKFFGGVPRVLIYDNLKTAVKEGWGKSAREQEKFKAFRAHYAYQARFCNLGEGHEKGLIENLVGFIRRNVLVPLPQVEGYEELNSLLRKRCLDYITIHQIKGRDLSVGEGFTLEQKNLLPLPVKPYETTKCCEARVDHFATVSFETNHYSVPVPLVGKMVTVKASALMVTISHRGEEVASHPRCYQKYQTRYQLAHYLPLLEIRPGSVFHARPVAAAHLPEELTIFAQQLPSPDKSMVRLLRLIVDHGVEEVLSAVQKARTNQYSSLDMIQYYLSHHEPHQTLPPFGPEVKAINLDAYDTLYLRGEEK